MSINIQSRKKRLINYIREAKDESTLSRIEDIIEKSISSLPPHGEPFTKEELNAGVDRAEKDFEEGRFYTTTRLKANLGL